MSTASAQCASHQNPQSRNDIEAMPVPQEYLALLLEHYENDNYIFCRGRFHVVLLTKVISIGVIPFYALILIFMIHFGNATAIMFTVIIIGSVATTTIHGAFRGSKLCLFPFVFLQVIFCIYDLVLLGLFSIAVLQRELSTSIVYRIYVDDIGSPQIVLLVISIPLLCALPPVIWTAYVVYTDILFIDELDRSLACIRELNENVSGDDIVPKITDF